MKRDFILPWPPSVNHYYKPVQNKRTRKLCVKKTARALSYRDEVYYTVGKQQPILGSVFLHAIANHPTKGRHDLDNLLKGLCDALEYANLYEDDSQIDRIIIERGNLVKKGEMIIQLGPMENKLLMP